MERLYERVLPTLRACPSLPAFGGAIGDQGSARKVGMIVLTLAFMALVALFAQMAPAANWYVATNGTGAGTSWADATNSIQGAIVASAAADTVWVSNGVYEAGGITNYPTGTVLTNRIAIYKAITVRSANNEPANTIIKGAWNPTTTNGPAAVRCVWMTNGSTLIGFTLTNGATLASGTDAERGGGVSCQSTNTVISNCIITGNSAVLYGGGAIFGTLFNCTLTRNSATYGGGAYVGTLFNCTLSYNSASSEGGGAGYGILNNCTLIGNSAVWNGGGARGGNLFNCTLSGNSAYSGGGVRDGTLSNCTLIGNSAPFGGGAYNATLYNCTLTSNSATTDAGGGAWGATLYNCTLTRNSAGSTGGGAWGATLYNCTLSGNSAYYGGGMRDGTLYNCTLTGNSGTYGGGACGGSLINCIVYGNTALTAGSNWYAVVAFTNTCTAPAATNGVGFITDNPLFIDPGSGYGSGHVAGNYRLRNVSPPRNAGTNFSWMTDPNDARSKDLDGRPRIVGVSGQVDMGCYEYTAIGTLFMIQ